MDKNNRAKFHLGKKIKGQIISTKKSLLIFYTLKNRGYFIFMHKNAKRCG